MGLIASPSGQHFAFHPGMRGIPIIQNGRLIQGTTVRASEAWEWVESGGSAIIQKFANNVPIENAINPANLSKRGLTIRKAWTNSLKDNRDLSTGNWTNSSLSSADETGADGTANSAHTITDSSAGSAQNQAQSITVSNDSNTHAYFALIKKDSDTTRFPEIGIDLTGGTAVRERVIINTSTGSISAQRFNDGSSSITDAGDWWLVTGTLANNTTGNTTLSYAITPAFNGNGTSSVDATTQGSIIYDFGGVYLNSSYAGPPIITGAAVVTREADDITLTSFPWFNSAEGTFYSESAVPSQLFADERAIVSAITDTDNYLSVFYRNNQDDLIFASRVGAVNQAVILGSSIVANQIQKCAAAYKEDDFSFYVDGTQLGTDSSGSLPFVQEIRIGRREDSGEYLEGWLRALSYTARRDPNATLESVSGS